MRLHLSMSPLLRESAEKQRLARRRAAVAVRAATSEESVGPAGTVAIAGGLVASPIVLLSAYTLATTGEGLPPGPGGALGAAGAQLGTPIDCTSCCIGGEQAARVLCLHLTTGHNGHRGKTQCRPVMS